MDVPLTHTHAGSILASSGDDGCVRLWQANYLGAWLPISVIAPDGSPLSGAGGLKQPDNRQQQPVASIAAQQFPPLLNFGARARSPNGRNDAAVDKAPPTRSK